MSFPAVVKVHFLGKIHESDAGNSRLCSPFAIRLPRSVLKRGSAEKMMQKDDIVTKKATSQLGIFSCSSIYSTKIAPRVPDLHTRRQQIVKMT